MMIQLIDNAHVCNTVIYAFCAINQYCEHTIMQLLRKTYSNPGGEVENKISVHEIRLLFLHQLRRGQNG